MTAAGSPQRQRDAEKEVGGMARAQIIRGSAKEMDLVLVSGGAIGVVESVILKAGRRPSCGERRRVASPSQQ